MSEIVEFIEYPHTMVTVDSYRDAIEVLEDLAEIAVDIAPAFPVLRFWFEVN